MFLFAVLVIAGFALYVMKPDERRRALAALTGRGSHVQRAVLTNLQACGPWLEALRARGGRPVAAVAIAAVYFLFFAAVLPGIVAHGDDALVGWGASIGPRTTNGEWWRLLTAMFLHRGIVSLAIDMLAILQLGFVVERVFGRAVFTTVFIASGVVANVVHLATYPVAVRTGASGGLYGLYGLLAVWAVQGTRTQSEFAIPRPAYRLLAPVAGLFVLASVVSDAGGLMPAVAALTIGVVAGAVLVGSIQESWPSPMRLSALAASVGIVVVLMAFPSAGTTDVRPEIARVLDLEGRTVPPYAKATGQFKLGALSAEDLAGLIDRQILPEVHDVQGRLDRLHGVPAEYRALVDDARRYVTLRAQSWALRSRALHSSNMRTLRLADDKERDSLSALERLTGDSLR
jgi:rhomboid protease GluP